MQYSNIMQKPRIGKVVLNIGAGESGEKLVNAEKLLQKLTNCKPTRTFSSHRVPTWNLRKGEPIGCKVTLRGQAAEDFLKRAFYAKENKIKASNFDRVGNFSFGIAEYLDIQGMNYDPEIGIFGLDVTVTLERPGYRVKRRRIKNSKLPDNHKLNKEEAIEFIKEKFNVEIL